MNGIGNFMKKFDKKLNIILKIFIVLTLITIIFNIIGYIPYSNPQRRTVINYMREDSFVGMTLEECNDILGEPRFYRGNYAYYDAGFYARWTIFRIYCYQCELKVWLDETNTVERVDFTEEFEIPLEYFLYEIKGRE